MRKREAEQAMESTDAQQTTKAGWPGACSMEMTAGAAR